MSDRNPETTPRLPQPKTRRLDNSKVGYARILPFAAILFSVSTAGHSAQVEIFAADNFKIYGDFRARLESDLDSQRSSGIPRDDRTRVRIRARVGLTFKPSEIFSFDVRLRSGSDDSHQSPHITVLDFNGNDTGDADFNPDKWYLKATTEHAWGWVGRNSLPIWKQNELFWDDDVTPAGVAGGLNYDLGGGKFALNVGYFVLPVGMQEFSGNLGSGQIVFSTSFGSTGFTIAGGVFQFDADAGDPDAAALLNGNGARDYTIWTGSLEAKFKLGNGARPLALGLDIMHNGESYSATDPDPFTAANRNEKDGYVISARYGQLKKARDWLAAYYYARIETFAVNSSFAQDDWVRWGSATESRGSNMKGHEFRFAYAFSGKVNLVARLYIVEAITTEEDGVRARLDFNYKF